MRFRAYALAMAATAAAGLALAAFRDTPLPELLRSAEPGPPQTWGGWIAVSLTWAAGVATTVCGAVLVAWYAVALWRLRRARRRHGCQRGR